MGRAHRKGFMDIEPSRILQKAVAPYHSYLALVTLKYNIICIDLIVSKDFKSLQGVFLFKQQADHVNNILFTFLRFQLAFPVQIADRFVTRVSGSFLKWFKELKIFRSKILEIKSSNVLDWYRFKHVIIPAGRPRTPLILV